MSIRVRLTLALVLISVLPMAAMSLGLVAAIRQVQTIAITQSRQALETAGQKIIQEKAYAVADQIRLYLRLHPEINPRDYAALEANQDLRAIAVSPIGETGYTAVHDRNGVNHFHSNPAVVGTDLSTLSTRLPEFWALVEESLAGNPVQGYYDWLEPDGATIRAKYMAIVPVEGTDLLVAATTYIDEFSVPANQLSESLNKVASRSQALFASLFIIGTALAVATAVLLGNRLTRPIVRLTETIKKTEQGQQETAPYSAGRDEIGQLARAFNDMTGQVRETINTLEQRVAERTADLSRRASQVRAAAEVGAAAASLRDIDVLLNEAVRLIAERFEYYHVGIFLLDERGEYAVLRAANSAGGQRMLAREHRLKVGATGIVGYVTGAGEPRIALDVGADAVYFDNPDLPSTRSEMALPLRIGDRIIGALDVQSTAAGAFTSEDVATLRILADQIAVAIENARLIAQGQNALEAERRAYGALAREAWDRLSAAGGSLGYYGLNRDTVDRVGDRAWTPALQDAVRVGELRLDKKTGELAIPLKVRGETIGAIRVQKTEGQSWSDVEIQTVQTLTDQLSVALESARQYQETQARAERERQINVMAGQVRSAISTENILQNTIRELGKALGASRTFIQLGMPEDEQPGTGSSR